MLLKLRVLVHDRGSLAPCLCTFLLFLRLAAARPNHPGIYRSLYHPRDIYWPLLSSFYNFLYLGWQEFKIIFNLRESHHNCKEKKIHFVVFYMDLLLYFFLPTITIPKLKVFLELSILSFGYFSPSHHR